MDQTLSLYLLETLPLMDPQAPDYPLVLLTLVESILENPDIILRKQLDKVKSQKMAEMKMAGIEYDERMEELEKLEYPKPNREFIYSTFNAFADKHPWVGQENIRPKSIAREMFETFRSFSDYIRDYELQRAEGVLLRHLNSVYQGPRPNRARRRQERPVREMELYLGTMIRQVDSSLLDEWEKMRDPNYQRAETKEVRPPGAEEAAAGHHPRHQGLHRRHPQPHLHFPARPGECRLRNRASLAASRPRRGERVSSSSPPLLLRRGTGRGGCLGNNPRGCARPDSFR